MNTNPCNYVHGNHGNLLLLLLLHGLRGEGLAWLIVA